MRSGRREPRRPLAAGFLAAALLAPALVASAVDGVIEINDARALAGGVTPGDPPGYPVRLTQSGSYRLTSDLSVPAATDAIDVEISSVTIDLNGFRILGPFVCAAPCSSGAGIGISGNQGRTKIVNGEVSGFAGGGIAIGPFSLVEEVVVRSIGGDGVALGSAGMALANRIVLVGESGLAFSGSIPGAYRDNVLANTDTKGTGNPAVDGTAHATGGNLCEDRSCSARGARRFYVTTATSNGLQAPGACAAGYHFAALHEIRDTTVLEYDSRLGTTAGYDRSASAPAFLAGWVRTGGLSYSSGADPGRANCSLWTTSSASAFGSFAQLDPLWSAAPDEPARWTAAANSCNSPLRVWCVED
jgi:hypothetical protein